MIEEIHEILGFLSLADLCAIALLGAVVFYYRGLKSFVRLQRRTLVATHLNLSLALLALVLLHYATAKTAHPLQLAGAAILAGIFLLGVVVHYWKKAYRPLVLAKVTALVVAAPILLVGHWLVEEAGHENEHVSLSTIHPTALASEGASPHLPFAEGSLSGES